MPAGRLIRRTCRYFTWNVLGCVLFVATIVGITMINVWTTCLDGSEYPTTPSDVGKSQMKSPESPTEGTFQKISLDQTKSLQEPRPFICPDRDVFKSSKVTRLGRYPSNKRFLAIGIASVARPSGASYLLQTTQSLLNNTSERDKNNIQIVIFLADLHETPKSIMREELSRTFRKYIKQGLLTVIETYPEYYPELNNIKEKFHDSASRRMWRSKENVDNAFVMCYCKDFSRYYIHLEDDVKSSPSFLPKLEDLINEQPSTHWPMLDVAIKGSIAKIFQSHDLENAATFFYLMYDEMPLDWLMDHWRTIKDKESYNKPLASLFEHTGVKSTLAEKGPHGSDALEPFFDSYDHKYKGHNPPATVTSSISSFKGKPQDAYNKGGGYFWAGSSQKDDYILITFHKPTSVQKVFVDTGSHSASSDLLHFGILQASFESTEEGEMSDGANSCGNFHTIGSFDDGRAEIPCDESKMLTCLRIVLTQNHEPIFLREIDVWESLSSRMTGV